MPDTTYLEIPYFVGSDVPAGMEQQRQAVERIDFAISKRLPQVTVAAARNITIVPASGSQGVVTMAGWASTPACQVSLVTLFDWIWRIASATPTQLNIFVTTNEGDPLPDLTVVQVMVTMTGTPTDPDVTPTIT